MKIIGITGGVGCGKSTVLKLLSENFNAYVIMADDVAKELMQPGCDGYNKVVEMFGDDILADNKEINRVKLADIIFNNQNKRIVLNSIIHPLVKNSIIDKLTQLKISGEYEYVFIEAALLIEDHYDVFCDELWYIYAPVNVRSGRLKESRGYTDEKIKSVMNSQLSEEIFRDKCKVVIDNSNSLEFTLAQLVKLL